MTFLTCFLLLHSYTVKPNQFFHHWDALFIPSLLSRTIDENLPQTHNRHMFVLFSRQGKGQSAQKQDCRLCIQPCIQRRRCSRTSCFWFTLSSPSQGFFSDPIKFNSGNEQTRANTQGLNCADACFPPVLMSSLSRQK